MNRSASHLANRSTAFAATLPAALAGPAGGSAEAAHAAYEVRFESLFHPGRGLTFPCDAQGRVALHRLPDRARENYRRAQSQVGVEYATPAVRLADLH
ncbi:hypothetical protein [Sphaerotilus microaerophilus]|uniref:Uncharacterized protein n=1 Tax=Sphaerotilus microaerophilus TaxID=2914710 RepID=A0ABN6PKQ2_9BURK|nr:hypothetical protein [Sphaerotilus sp. FB-5]BDI05744.1 hypothetical protein CATMQ487_27140 [Sphaerotilus sp. FB-5]